MVNLIASASRSGESRTFGKIGFKRVFITGLVALCGLAALFVGTRLAGASYQANSNSFWQKVVRPTAATTPSLPQKALPKQRTAQLTANKIAAENSLTGNPASEWDITGDGDQNIQGFATDMSVNLGQTIGFKIDTDSPNYRLDIYRMGYYGGMGARKIAAVLPSATLPQNQPACQNDEATGLIDCSNWSVSASWTVPADATSGIYFAKLVRLDATPGESHVMFIVRDDNGHSDLLFQTSDTTWQAYNQYGGNSLYTGSPDGRAYKVSYDRPFTTRRTSGEDWLFNAEYPMVRWLERNGYDVSYFTGVDSARLGAEILEHKVFLSVGHDEYWSGTQRANVEAARDAGVHLAFFSGNESFWKTRWEPDGAGTPNRTLVCYKETHANAKIDPQPNVWTGSWRDPRFSPPADGGRPENSLTGNIFMVNSGTTSITVPEADGKMRLWRTTDIAALPPGGEATLAADTLGYEWDEDIDNGARPAGLIRMSSTSVNGVQILQDYGSTYGSGDAAHHLTFYRHDNPGAVPDSLVFATGTVQWPWGLDDNHDRGNGPVDQRMQQATVNLFADMGVQPATIQTDLSAATASTDATPPTSSIVAPSDGATVSSGSPTTITGTASDSGGGVVGGVEVSIDGGLTWHPANGRGSWSYAWTPGPVGPATIKSRAIDDSGNIQSTPQSINVTIEPPSAPVCPCTIWDNTAAPDVANENDGQSIEPGVKFRSDTAGYIIGVRFYKGDENTGTHTGHLWSIDGTQLASAVFTNESASGWQQVNFSPAVQIEANTTYVASYYSSGGGYSFTNPYFATGIDRGPLHALANGVDGPNAVYKYGGGFPTDNFQTSNYWVDVIFDTEVGPDTMPPTVISTTPASGGANVGVGSNITATLSEAIDAATINSNSFELRDSSNALVPANISYNASTHAATLDPTSALENSVTYTATVKTGVKDIAGNALAADYSWTFNTAGPPPDEGPGGPILVVSAASNPFSRYYAEILRAEGMNDFTVKDISTVDAVTLNTYQVVIVGEIPLTMTQAAMFGDWVNAGGNLIAMRPDPNLATLLGLTSTGTTLSDQYMLVDTSSGAGSGIVDQTIQFHGTADRYALNGATSVATLYSNSTTATSNPAVTIRNIGSNGGQAAAFSYDLARSVVYTRQGNPAWAGDERDGQDGPIRSDDLFFGSKTEDVHPDWVDLNKVAIPQADEQQRLLANMITQMDLDKMPLPRFWYFPKGLKAVVVLTGDDHGNGGTPGQFDNYIADSTAGCSVDDWECIRSTSYIFESTPLTNAQAAVYQADGFEIGLHVNTNCSNFTPPSLENFFSDQLTSWSSKYTSLNSPVTNRTHCIAWSDWATHPKVELNHGIRLDANYYYWPGAWVQDRPGMFTGSGMPMRFADLDGSTIDVYQAATQMTDESDITIPTHIEALLGKALGPEGYYGAFTANMHTDSSDHPGANAIVASAISHGVPVVSAKQMLTWLDGRNGSSFGNLSWSGNILIFNVSTATGARNLRAMVPAMSAVGALTGITFNGNPVVYTTQTIKGVQYAFFPAATGTYAATYALDNTAPTVTTVFPTDASTNVDTGSNVTAAFSEAMDASTMSAATFELRDSSNTLVPSVVTYDPSTHLMTLDPTASLSSSTSYTAKVKGGVAGVKDAAGNPLATDHAWSFTTAAESTGVCPCSIWSDATTPANPAANDGRPIEVGVKFRSNTSGFVRGVRFYKGLANTGTHTGHLWTAVGTQLAEATFTNETDSGWQTVTFPIPVVIAANTTYVASYYSPLGYFAYENDYFANAGVTNGPLTALQSGVDGPNGVFNYDSSAFPTSGSNDGYWVDVVFDTSGTETTPPTITGRFPAPGSTAVPTVTNVTVQFSGPMDAATITSQNFRLRAEGSATDVDALVSYSSGSATLDPSTALAPNTLYHVTVSGNVKDANGNPLGADDLWSFTTANNSFTDTTAADFNAGDPGSHTYVSQIGDGEVILDPKSGTEFSGSALPADWSSSIWNSGGGATVSGGQLTVDGAFASTSSMFGPGRSLEFSATFGPAQFEHAGFAVDLNNVGLWAIFSTKDTTSGLYARTNNNGSQTDTLIPGNWLGAPHRYRIDWNAAGIIYSIDGVVVQTDAVSISDNMRPVVSEFNSGGGSISVDWLHMSPYPGSGMFTSRVFDAGNPVDWISLSDTALTPIGTSLSFESRSGNTAFPDGTWSGWQGISSGVIASPNARYIQYRATLATSSDAVSPELDEVTLNFQTATNHVPSANNDAYSVNENGILVVGPPNAVLTNDSDVDGDALTAVLDSGTSHGNLTFNSDGTLTYTPAAGDSGADSFTYHVNDGHADSNIATVVITVNVVNGPLIVNLTTDEHDASLADGECDVDLSTPGPQCTLRAAIEQANAASTDDNITFSLPAGSTITLSSVNGEMTIPASGNSGKLQIIGPGANQLTINGGTGSNRIFSIADTTVVLSGLTLKGGGGTGTNGSGFGGALYVENSDVTLDRLHVTANSATVAGGTYFASGSLRVSNSTFSTNTAGDCGAIKTVSGSLRIVNSTFSGNSATNTGGGICNAGATATLRGVTLSNNNAAQGGGLFVNGGSLDLGNTAVASNTAANDPELAFVAGSITSSGGNLVGDSIGDAANTGTPVAYLSSDIRDSNPHLTPLQNNGGPTPTHVPLAGSPLIDKGLNSSAVDPDTGAPLTTDQRGDGFPRLTDGDNNGIVTVDIGACEARFLSTTAASVTVTGRVLTASGQAVIGAIISATDPRGNVRIGRTNPFGYYHITEMQAGASYVFTVSSRRYTFAPQLVSVDDNLTDLNFVADR